LQYARLRTRAISAVYARSSGQRVQPDSSLVMRSIVSMATSVGEGRGSGSLSSEESGVSGIDRRGMALLSLAHVFDDINQSFLPTLLPFLALFELRLRR